MELGSSLEGEILSADAGLRRPSSCGRVATWLGGGGRDETGCIEVRIRGCRAARGTARFKAGGGGLPRHLLIL